MTALLLLILTFRHAPPAPQPLAVGHHVWVLGSDDWGKEVKRDWGEVVEVCGDTVTVQGTAFFWDCKRWGVRRIGDK